MIVATNSSFNAANNKQLKKLVAMLKPGAIIPDRRNIGGNLLDEIYEEEQAKVKHLISGMSATIAIDGWSTITNQPIIGICIYAAGNCYLVDTIDTTGDSHTTEFLVDLLLHQIEEIQEKWEVNITSVVSDNAANMAAMRTRIKELDQPFVENLFKEAYKELKPDTWWKSGVKMGFNPAFAEAAGALVASVASSAGLERQFSTLGMSYGKLRANLDSQKAGKLAFLYRQLNV